MQRDILFRNDFYVKNSSKHGHFLIINIVLAARDETCSASVIVIPDTPIIPNRSKIKSINLNNRYTQQPRFTNY